MLVAYSSSGSSSYANVIAASADGDVLATRARISRRVSSSRYDNMYSQLSTGLAGAGGGGGAGSGGAYA